MKRGDGLLEVALQTSPDRKASALAHWHVDAVKVLNDHNFCRRGPGIAPKEIVIASMYEDTDNRLRESNTDIFAVGDWRVKTA